MLETIREYTIEKLRSMGSEALAGRRHLAYVLEMAEQEAGELAGPRPDAGLIRLESELDNIRAAMAHAQSDPELAEDALRLGAALWPFWLLRNRFLEGSAFLTSVLSRSAPSRSASPARATALLGAAILAFHLRSFEENLEFAPRSLAAFRELGDPAGIAAASLHLGHVHSGGPETRILLRESVEACRLKGWSLGTGIALVNLGVLAWRQGDVSRAVALLEEGAERMMVNDTDRTPAFFCLYLAPLAQHISGYAGARALLERALVAVRNTGWGLSAASLVVALGDLAGRQGDAPAALEYLQQAITFHRESGNPVALAYAHQDMGNLHYRLQDYRSAETAYRDSLALFRRLGNTVGLDMACNNLGSTLLHLDDPSGARPLHLEALKLYRQEGLVEGIVWSLERLAILEALHGDPKRRAHPGFGRPRPSGARQTSRRLGRSRLGECRAGPEACAGRRRIRAGIRK